MPRKKKEVDVALETPINVITEIDTKVAAAKASFDVYNVNGTLVRSYSMESHGEEAQTLAEEYAQKIGGKVL